MVESFRGEYRYLSNFQAVKIIFEGIEYPSIEHAYMSAKSDSMEWKSKCADKNITAGKIKRLSHTISLKADWDDIKLDVMTEVIDQKFNQEPFNTLLLDTGDKYIQEGNRHNDTFWGFCLETNKGENNLGKLIMEKRNMIKIVQRTTNDEIDTLVDNQIFVFGSNESGIHGGGAARKAFDDFMAEWGNPEGLQGQTYAIPTKNKNHKATLSIDEIKVYVDRFIEFAKNDSEHQFLVTEIGCGLAGLSTVDVGPLFKDCKDMDNVSLPQLFWKEIL